MQQIIKLSVRRLVEFIMRYGSIDSRFTGLDRALEGSRIHRKLQKESGSNYTPEVTLSYKTQYEGIFYEIEGRADGIILQGETVIIDEIKTTAVPFIKIDENFNPLHWTQAFCYGFFYCYQNQLDHITIQLTYYNIDTDEIKKFQKKHTIEELELFFIDLMKEYQKWAVFYLDWTKKRNESINQLTFPFPQYRKGQRALAVAVYRSIEAEHKLYGEAPTGIGKTISVLFPAIKAMGQEKAEKIFYLTAKTITRIAAENAIASLRKQGIHLKSVTLTAKDKICFLEERLCMPENCKYADGHFDRINLAIFEALQSEDHFSKEVLEQLAEKYAVCPYELSLDISQWCDCIICDYNYVFHPQINLGRFFSDSKKNYVFLIDEAHNLIDRARDMFSAELKKSRFSELKKILEKEEKKLISSISKINTAMVNMRKECQEQGFVVYKCKLEDYLSLLYRFTNACEQYLEQHKNEKIPADLLQVYFDTIAYLKIAEQYDEHYITFITTKNNEVWVRQLCLDPSLLLQEAMKRGKSSILFSATLTPIEYYLSILGGDATSKRILLPSPFAQEYMGLYIVNYISTRYKERTNSMQMLIRLIYETTKAKKGNYIVFFPSYQYMNEVFDEFISIYHEINVLIQQNTMTEMEREQFLEQFKEENPETLIAFCVLGGMFSEGIDLKGNRLIGTIIVGVGLPQINTEQNILRDYYNQINGMGYEFAYIYPGMNKVMQAAGRVIRDMNEKGIILLVDDRFSSKAYQKLFPAHWSHYKLLYNLEETKKEINSFWNKHVENAKVQ